jgi:hypothetical protein
MSDSGVLDALQEENKPGRLNGKYKHGLRVWIVQDLSKFAIMDLDADSLQCSCDDA